MSCMHTNQGGDPRNFIQYDLEEELNVAENVTDTYFKKMKYCNLQF